MRAIPNGRWVAAFTALAAYLGLPGAAAAQVNVQGSSSARIANNLTLTNVDDLAYGAIVAGDAGGTVSINASNGAVTQVGDVRTLASVRHRGKFALKAPLGVLLLIGGDPTVTLNRIGGGGTMTAALQYRAGSGIGSLPLAPATLMVIAPDQTINVGGTLTVAPAQAAGDYTGTYSLSVIYL